MLCIPAYSGRAVTVYSVVGTALNICCVIPANSPAEKIAGRFWDCAWCCDHLLHLKKTAKPPPLMQALTRDSCASCQDSKSTVIGVIKSSQWQQTCFSI